MMFVDRLIENIKKTDNPTVMGLDPRIDYVPDCIKTKVFQEYGNGLQGAAKAILEFNKQLLDCTADIIPAVKPQSAYYELYGIAGLMTLKETVDYAKAKGFCVILDAKRGDMGSTADAYAEAYLGKTKTGEGMVESFGADCMTVNGYLGEDGVFPFIKMCDEYDKGIFVLVKTSNPSSAQLQDLIVKKHGMLQNEQGKNAEQTVYECMAELVHGWGSKRIGKYGYSSIGAVVGATYPEEAERARAIMPAAYILVPGYGAQGGGASGAVKAFHRKDGMGAIVNSSRNLMCAYRSEMWKNKYDDAHFAEATRAEALRMKADLNAALEVHCSQ